LSDTSSYGVPPGGDTVPYGVSGFELVNCTATSATLQVSYSAVVEGLSFWKYILDSWVEMTPTNSSLVVSGTTASFSVADNGPFDADSAVGQISDPFGPGYLTLPSLPGSPLNVTAHAGSNQATVSWSAPSSGGTPVQYLVTSSPGQATCSVMAPQQSCQVQGLTNGISYTFTVVAQNAGGSGTASQPSNAVIPNTPSPSPSPASASCGGANGMNTLAAPVHSLCGSGLPGPLSASNGVWSWQCILPGSATANCSAPGAVSPSSPDTITFELFNATSCSLGATSLVNTPTPPEAGVAFPDGLVNFALSTCLGNPEVRLTSSGNLQNNTVWEWGHQIWLIYPSATILNNEAYFSIVDDGPNDLNPRPGAISGSAAIGSYGHRLLQNTLSLSANVTNIELPVLPSKLGHSVLLTVSGGSGTGAISYLAQAGGGISCSINKTSSTGALLNISGNIGGFCNVWAVKGADPTYEGQVSNVIFVQSTHP
jgi:hypothetical protein